MIKRLRETFIKELSKETNLLIVQTDNNFKKPKYPYYSYKFTTTRQNVGEGGVYRYDFDKSLDDRFKYDVINHVEFQPKVIMSFNCYSNDDFEAEDYILKAWEWFRLKGRRILSYENIVVVNVGDIADRTIFLEDSYEYRKGFDVEFRVLHQFSDRSETIETYKINGKIEGGRK